MCRLQNPAQQSYDAEVWVWMGIGIHISNKTKGTFVAESEDHILRNTEGPVKFFLRKPMGQSRQTDLLGLRRAGSDWKTKAPQVYWV